MEVTEYQRTDTPTPPEKWRELTMHLELATTRRVGRKKEWPEEIRLSLAGGTLDRIASVLKPDEFRLDMIREAIEREIKRRKREARK